MGKGRVASSGQKQGVSWDFELVGRLDQLAGLQACAVIFSS
jgi:hypothetical protein